MQHNSVPTTCTASLLTGWALPGVGDKDPKVKVNAQLKVVDELIKLGYKEDFSIIHAFTTELQVKSDSLEEFFPKLGFERVFKTTKDEDVQRHKETGGLSLWAVEPKVYKKCLTEFHKELTDLKEKIDPPKKPDPARQKFPDLLLSALRAEKIVQNNTSIDNRLELVLLVTPEVAYRHIKMKFGIDIKKFRDLGTGWTRITTRQLKEFQKQWKEELV